jgi:hypothetical protein
MTRSLRDPALPGFAKERDDAAADNQTCANIGAGWDNPYLLNQATNDLEHLAPPKRVAEGLRKGDKGGIDDSLPDEAEGHALDALRAKANLAGALIDHRLGLALDWH